MVTDNRSESSTTIEQVVRAQKGDEVAIRDLYLRHRTDVFRYLFYHVGDAQVAEDLTSEVFIRMLRALPSFQPRGSFQAWLYQIAHNIAIDYHRKEKGKTSLPLTENLAADSEEPPEAVERQLNNQSLQRALAQLNQAQREVLILRFIQRHSIEEAALALKCSEDAVKGLQRRGLIALRQILEDRSTSNAKP
ncbi:MAG: RNA polymerase sigma factor [Anaerolineales bacterium]|nr:RNA polymerase sigma factor [Anaerolineales bacterium]